jgi:hypothetical protein
LRYHQVFADCAQGYILLLVTVTLQQALLPKRASNQTDLLPIIMLRAWHDVLDYFLKQAEAEWH